MAVAVNEAHCLQVVSDLLTYDKNKSMPTIRGSKDFHPSFGALKNLRAFVPSGAPMLATTATVTLISDEE